jgi:hypothetical protein
MPMEDPNVGALSCPPSTKALRYQRVKAYDNHLWVNDCNMEGMVNFGCKVISIFGQWQTHDIGDEHASIQHVGVLNEILILNYGPISTPFIHMLMHPHTPWNTQMWIWKWKQRKKELGYVP